MPPGSKTLDYTYVLENIIEPVCNQFKADFYYLDVGFDGHQKDHLSSLLLDDNFYPWIAGYMQKITKTDTYLGRWLHQSWHGPVQLENDKGVNG